MSKHLSIILLLISTLSCKVQKTEREIEDEFVKKYAPANLNTHGFTVAVDSKIPEVHQLFNDLSANFYFYGDKEEYEKIAAKIMALDPNFGSGFLMGGFYEQDQKKYKEKVIKALELSKKSNLKSERYFMEAEYYLLVKEDYLKAQKYFQKVVDIYPDCPSAIWSLGMAYYYNGEYDEALACYKKSTELIPNLPKGYEFMSAVFYCKKQYKKALEYLELAKKYGANTKNDIYYAEYEQATYLKNELYEQTIKSVEKAYTYGDYFKDSESLKKTYKEAKAKLDSIQLSKLHK